MTVEQSATPRPNGGVPLEMSHESGHLDRMPSMQPSGAVHRPLNREERRQREHELTQALIAARMLQARLELLGDRALDVRVVLALRNSLAADVVAQPPIDDTENIRAAAASVPHG